MSDMSVLYVIKWYCGIIQKSTCEPLFILLIKWKATLFKYYFNSSTLIIKEDGGVITSFKPAESYYVRYRLFRTNNRY